jgi:hypothetical protein
MTYSPSADMRAWLEAEDFVPPSDGSDCWEVAWGHTIGYGYITFRLCPNDYGWEILLLSGSGEEQRSVDIGDTGSLEQIQRIFYALRSLEWQGHLPPRTPEALAQDDS